MILKLIVIALIRLMSIVCSMGDYEIVIEDEDAYAYMSEISADDVVELYNHQESWFIDSEEEQEGANLWVVAYEMPNKEQVYGVQLTVAYDDENYVSCVIVDEDWDCVCWGIW